jgi:hypothetical protein
MNKISIVYSASGGYYSDYSVYRLFTSKEMAQEYCDSENKKRKLETTDKYYIEQFELEDTDTHIDTTTENQ